MASKARIAQCLGIVSTIYPNYAQGKDANKITDVWTALLADYTDEEVSLGLEEAMKVCRFAPTPAEVIERIMAIRNSLLPTGHELWLTYRKMLSEHYRLEPYLTCFEVTSDGTPVAVKAKAKMQALFDEAPDEIKEFLGGYEGLKIKSRELSENDLRFEEQRFLKELPDIRERLKSVQLMNTLGIMLKSADERKKLK